MKNDQKLIAKLERNIERDKKRLARLVRENIATCPHEKVMHADYSPSRSGLFKGIKATRMCVDCGLEESSFHWPTRKYKRNEDGELIRVIDTKLNTKFLKIVQHEEIWRNRKYGGIIREFN